MKLRFVSLVAAISLLVSCGTTTRVDTSANPAYGLPTNIRYSFQTMYPDATNVTMTQYDAGTVPIDWELVGWTSLDPSAHTVSFTVGNDQYYAWYDANGNWIGTTYAISDYTRLPYAVSSILNSNYNGYSIESVQREMWKDQTAYEIKLSNGDNKMKLLVDNKGNVIKTK
jgi:hypothetical protein